MKLSIIILNYNVRYFLEVCLQSVEAAISSIDAEIIVVDNNSQDDSCAIVRDKFPNVILIENKENSGFSKGNNLGFKRAKGEYICILNPDTVVGETTFSSILEYANTKTNLGIVGCKLVDGSGQFLPESKRHIPTPKVAISKMLGRDTTYYVHSLGQDAVGETPVFVGAFMLMKYAVYNEVNGFDEDYFMYGEDIDLSYKVLKAGYTNYYFGKTTVIHYKGESTLKDKVYAKRFYGAMQIFYKKHFKSNLVFNGFLWLGIQMASLLNAEKPSIELKKEAIFVCASNGKNDYTARFPFPVKQIEQLTQATPNSEIIFDANYLTFSEIISVISGSDKNKNFTFKILPKNSNFILGSNSSKSRGEVIAFKY
ncbi:glycosyltransferase family 2 protein [Bizionia saleffrena]|uniref:Glycosyltransferase family 2 protein n=1 Tax=Bizionia saleffrena TaxID=291189 RepID=A0A8H2QGJ6_9FLAO|nr:glycosyltransferase family 2 protein [Bizionia saleffrena]TYB80221.1 glycosyltransferase family 2 protein [Bizionia saleffrena]